MTAIDRRYRLSDAPGSLGLRCDVDGLSLAGVLLTKSISGFAPRTAAEIEALIKAAYRDEIDVEILALSLKGIATALNSNDLPRAMIGALRLRLPELDWDKAARIASINEALSKYESNEPRDWHGRWITGGRSAPSGSKPQSFQIAAPDLAPSEVNYDALIPVAYNGRFHDQAVADLATYLRSKGETVETEVRLAMADDSARVRIDILAYDPVTKVVYGIEVKTGDRPGFTPGQLTVYPHIMMGGSIISTDTDVIALGLLPGTILKPIPIYLMYQLSDNKERLFRELDPAKMSI